jgi:hypothetical protein
MQELERTDLEDPVSVARGVMAVKTYAQAKMRKAKSNAVGQPGGKVSLSLDRQPVR